MNTPVYGSALREQGAGLQTLKVSASIIPDMYLRITEGSAFINRQLVEYAGGRIGPLVVPTVNVYIVVIALKGNSPIILYGDIADNNPKLPNIPSDALPLAAIVLRSTDTVISQDMVQDIRPLFSATTYLESHKDLIDKDIEDQHPIAAITGLQAALDGKVDNADLSPRFDAKADYNGTRAATFTLNNASVGVPTNNIVLEFKRGAMPSAAIRFNEELDRLEFTDNGNEWNPLDTTLKLDPFNEENYYTKTQVDEKVTSLNKAVSLKADAARVESLAANLTTFARQDDVNNMFLDLYSKQDLDRIVAQMKEGLTTITNKADIDQVYTKEETDQLVNEAKDNANSQIANLTVKVDSITEEVTEEMAPKLQELSESVDEKIAAAKEEFADATSAAVATVQDMETELTNKIDNGLAGVEQRINSSAATAIAMVSEKTGQLDAKFDMAIAQANEKYDSLLDDFETTKTTITETVDELSGKVTGFDDGIAANKAEIDELKIAKTEADNQFSELDTTITSIQNSITAIEDKNTSQDETIAANKAACDEHQATVDQHLEDIDSSVTAINETLDAQQTAIDDVKADLADAKTNLNNAINTKAEEITATMTTLEETLTAKDTEIVDSVNSLSESVDAKVEEINTSVEDAKAEVKQDVADAKNEFNEAIEEATTTLGAAYSAADQAIVDNVNSQISALEVALANKADNDTVATKEELNEAIENIDVTDSVYTKDEVDNFLGEKASIADVYKYTQAQIDTTLSNKQEALGYTPEDAANKNQANGYAGLDNNGKISINQIPDSARQKTNVCANAQARIALTDLIEGDRAFEIDTGNSYIYDGTKWILQAAADWENVNIDFSNIVGTPTTLAGYGITDAISTSANTTALAAKAEKDHTHPASEITVSDERMFISAAKLAEIDAKANSADVYSKEAADTKFETKTDFATTIADYSTTSAMNTAIDNAINNEMVYHYTKTDINDLLSNKLDKSDESVAKVADVTSAINEAKTELQTNIDAKANSTDVYTKSEVYTKTETNNEIDTAVDAGIQGALESVNAAINEALGNQQGGGSDSDLANVVASTKTLIKQLSTDKDNKIAAVEEKIIQQVVTKESIVETIKEETDIDLSALSTKDETTSAINTAKADLQGQITTINTTLDTKADSSTVSNLTTTVGTISSNLEATTAKANATEESLASYIPVISGKTTMAEVENKLANYTTTEALTALLGEKATPADIAEALELYMLKSDIEAALGTKLTADDVANMLASYLTISSAEELFAAKANKADLLNSTGALYNNLAATANGYTGSYTKIFNELNSGGGSQVYNSSDDTLSYVGVNLSNSGDPVQVQIYAKHNSGSQKNIGTRLNVNTDLGMFYLKGTTNATPFPTDREIAVLADIEAAKTELQGLITTLSEKVDEYKELVDAIGISDINDKIADLAERVTTLEGLG